MAMIAVGCLLCLCAIDVDQLKELWLCWHKLRFLHKSEKECSKGWSMTKCDC